MGEQPRKLEKKITAQGGGGVIDQCHKREKILKEKREKRGKCEKQKDED
jgi:hypothetical protein